MTERPKPISGEYENRTEYHANVAQQQVLKQHALESIEDLLQTEKANHNTEIRYSYNDGVAVRKLTLAHVDTTQEDEVLFVNGYASETRQLERLSISTDVTVRTKMYREGVHREAAEVSIREFVEGSRQPFISRYTIDQYVGGVLQAVVGRTDVLRSRGLDEREMLPYDFHEFEQQMRIITAMRKGMLVSGSRHVGTE